MLTTVKQPVDHHGLRKNGRDATGLQILWALELVCHCKPRDLSETAAEASKAFNDRSRDTRLLCKRREAGGVAAREHLVSILNSIEELLGEEISAELEGSCEGALERCLCLLQELEAKEGKRH